MHVLTPDPGILSLVNKAVRAPSGLDAKGARSMRIPCLWYLHTGSEWPR